MPGGNTWLELGALPLPLAARLLRPKQVVREWGLPAPADSVELVVSELVPSAIQALGQVRAGISGWRNAIGH
jgi:hypothetical protein